MRVSSVVWLGVEGEEGGKLEEESDPLLVGTIGITSGHALTRALSTTSSKRLERVRLLLVLLIQLIGERRRTREGGKTNRSFELLHVVYGLGGGGLLGHRHQRLLIRVRRKDKEVKEVGDEIEPQVRAGGSLVCGASGASPCGPEARCHVAGPPGRGRSPQNDP